MRPAASARRGTARRLPIFILIHLSLATALACGSGANSGPNASQRATGLAQTAAAVLTGTAEASITPPTPTPPPPSTTLAPPAQSATPTTTPTTVPATVKPDATASATACPDNDSDFVSDVNLPDGSHVAASATFKKTWRLRNSGPCVWTTAYTLRFISGEAMGGGAVNLPNSVPPGATVDISVSMVAPSNAGTYISHWQMFTPAGVAFGTKPFVEIKVP